MAQLTITFGLAVLSVSLWTLRVAVTARGNRTLGSGIAMVEALTFVTVYSQVINSTDGPANMIVYGLGVGLGTFFGVSVDRKIRSFPKDAGCLRHGTLPESPGTRVAWSAPPLLPSGTNNEEKRRDPNRRARINR